MTSPTRSLAPAEIAGLLQSMGWVGMTRLTARWFPFSTYGTVMGILSLSYLFGDFLTRLVDGECSYTWAVPKDIAARCLPALQSWAAARFDLTREVPMPREIVWRVYVKA